MILPVAFLQEERPCHCMPTLLLRFKANYEKKKRGYPNFPLPSERSSSAQSQPGAETFVFSALSRHHTQLQLAYFNHPCLRTLVRIKTISSGLKAAWQSNIYDVLCSFPAKIISGTQHDGVHETVPYMYINMFDTVWPLCTIFVSITNEFHHQTTV